MMDICICPSIRYSLSKLYASAHTSDQTLRRWAHKQFAAVSQHDLQVWASFSACGTRTAIVGTIAGARSVGNSRGRLALDFDGL
jgi:hypothetical protein